jgi:uncharacterized protein with von Willebrand factor type A (vWA) domain
MKMTNIESAAIDLRNTMRSEIRSLWASIAFMSRDERRPVYAEIRRLEKILERACRLAR